MAKIKSKTKQQSRCFYDPCLLEPGKSGCAVNTCVKPPQINPNIVTLPLDLRFVQFIHPGGEHKVTKDPKTGAFFTRWNYGRHQRKVLKVNGQCVDGGKIVKDTLIFWGEWEADSRAVPISPMPSLSDPNVAHYLHTPELRLDRTTGKPVYPKPGQPGVNTDPLVFGDAFYYSCCQQLRSYKKSGITSATALHHLERGSIILFGSPYNVNKPNQGFLLDTVFVVAESKLFDTSSFEADLKGFVFPDYFPIMGLYSSTTPGYIFRCYKGANPDNNVGGMFSFAPCYRANNPGLNMTRLSRPVLRYSDFSGITLPSAIPNEKMTQGFKSCIVSLSLNKVIWQRVVDIITKQGFVMGVKFDFNKVLIP